jgi:hypothetical protein
MLALAGNLTPPFPFAGSFAMYDGQEVTIHQRIGTDRALIHGPGITSRVDIADLSPAATAGAFHQWRDARLVAEPLDGAATPAEHLYADFVVWLETTDFEANRYACRKAFDAALKGAGYTSAKVPVRGFVPGSRPYVATTWNAVLIEELDA